MSGTTYSNPPAPVDTGSRTKTHLLVVEDEPVIRQLFSTLLQAAGYSVAQAEDGFAALEEVRRRRPALILSDLNMPRMTGFELLSVIRRRFPSVHVIAMSGAFSNDEVPAGVAADAFYQKSGRHISTLVEVIEDLLKSSKEDAPKLLPATPIPANKPQVALWVSRRGTPIDGPYILLTCGECLRSFPHPTSEETTMNVSETVCIFCHAVISYALLDPSITHHPGYAPADTPHSDV
jgi:CheY-like chemotaxis protein